MGVVGADTRGQAGQLRRPVGLVVVLVVVVSVSALFISRGGGGMEASLAGDLGLESTDEVVVLSREDHEGIAAGAIVLVRRQATYRLAWVSKLTTDAPWRTVHAEALMLGPTGGPMTGRTTVFEREYSRRPTADEMKSFYDWTAPWRKPKWRMVDLRDLQ